MAATALSSARLFARRAGAGTSASRRMGSPKLPMRRSDGRGRVERPGRPQAVGRCAGSAAADRLPVRHRPRRVHSTTDVSGVTRCGWRTRARLRIAVDLPSGVASDHGAILSPVPRFDLTRRRRVRSSRRTACNPRPEHCGRDGGRSTSGLATIREPHSSRSARPVASAADRRWIINIAAAWSRSSAGSMAGAGLLAASAAQRAGAGYVLHRRWARAAGGPARARSPCRSGWVLPRGDSHGRTDRRAGGRPGARARRGCAAGCSRPRWMPRPRRW